MSTAPIWVLNIARSTDRRQFMEAQLSALGHPYEFIDAVDGSTLTADQLSALAGPRAFDVQPWLGRAMSASEIGCALSHALVWRRLAEGTTPSALILEDDVTIGASLTAILSSLELRSWPLVLLGHHSSRFPWVPGAPFDHKHGAVTAFAGESIAADSRIARLAEYAQGAYGYWLTREGARALWQAAMPIRMPADSVTGYAPKFGLKSYALTPPVIVPSDRFGTTMLDPRPCPCRVCAAARLAAAQGATLDSTEECLAERTGLKESARAIAGRAFLLARRLGFAPGSFWAPPFR